MADRVAHELTGADGVLLAGGAGRRLSGALAPDGRPAGAKPGAALAGRPLIAYPAGVLACVCPRVVVVAKAATALPDLAGVERWAEPDEPRHPLTGIIAALERSAGAVLVCGADMPFVTVEACRALLATAEGPPPPAPSSTPSRAPRGSGALGAAATVACDGAGDLQPLLAVYRPAALAGLLAAAPDAPLRATVAALEPVRVVLPARVLRGVNTQEELARAELALARP